MASYSTLSEFGSLALNGNAVEGYEYSAVDCLGAARGEMDGYFRAAGIDLPLPATSIDLNIKRYEGWLAALPFMMARGFDPSANPDSIFVNQYNMAKAWLKDVAAKRTIIVPLVAGVEQDGDTSSDGVGAVVVSDRRRGWGDSYP